VDRDELTVAFLVRMFGVLNGVGIADATEPDHAHDAANKDGNLKQRLRALSARDTARRDPRSHAVRRAELAASARESRRRVTPGPKPWLPCRSARHHRRDRLAG
jgi:hypothetical protein